MNLSVVWLFTNSSMRDWRYLARFRICLRPTTNCCQTFVDQNWGFEALNLREIKSYSHMLKFKIFVIFWAKLEMQSKRKGNRFFLPKFVLFPPNCVLFLSKFLEKPKLKPISSLKLAVFIHFSSLIRPKKVSTLTAWD